ncbi:MAG: T9SS type A sorting domain-containing protein [Ignavibacteriales bacterium]|nr:T9SS type A sorting domain-containing protein [Ignavibacteriales bacterium]
MGGASGGSVTLKIYDVLGNEVATLVDEYKTAGRFEVEFNSVETRHGVSLPSGVYYYQLKVGSYIQTKKMILLR